MVLIPYLDGSLSKQGFICAVCHSLHDVALFPIQYVSYRLSRSYNINTQTFSAWMKDEVISFWVNFGLMFLIVMVLYALMKKSTKNGGCMPGFYLYHFHYCSCLYNQFSSIRSIMNFIH